MNDCRERRAVLVVENASRANDALADHLREHFDVLSADRADRALELVAAHRFSVIVCEANVPGMGRDDFLARVRERAHAARIVLAGVEDGDETGRAFDERGIYESLCGPIDPRELRLTVRHAARQSAVEEELEEERRLLRLLMDNVPDGIFFKDRELRYVRVNRSLAQRLGVADPESLIGRRIGDFLPSDEAAPREVEDRRVVEGREPVVEDMRRITDSRGVSRWYAISKTPVVDERGEVRGLMGIARDVDDRHSAEARLDESESRFRDFAHIASDWFWEMNADLRFTYLSERVEETLGEPAASLIGKRRGEKGFVEADGCPLSDHQADLSARRPFRNFVYGHPRPDGAIAWIATSGLPRFDAEGQFIGYRGTGRNVTAEREALRNLREREREVRLLLESTAEAIYGVDREGRCTFLNPSAVRMLGYEKASDLVGRKLHDLIHHTRGDGSHYPREECPFADALASGEARRSTEEIFWRADGSAFYADVAMHPVVRDGELDGAVLSFFDVTDRRRAESAVELVSRIAVALGHADHIESALETTLRLICESFGWKLGEAWAPSSEGRALERVAVVHDPEPALERFAHSGRALRFNPGESLPGRVWASCEAEWLPDPANAPRTLFHRCESIKGTGLHGVCAIPVVADNEVVAVLMFFSATSNEEDNLRTQALTAAVAPLAAFLKRIAVEDALREADARLNLALEAAGIGTWDWELDEDRLRWDAYMLPLFGVTEASSPRNIEDLIHLVHVDDVAALASEIETAVEQHRDFETEYRIIRPNDGEVRVVAARGRVYRDESDLPVRMTGVNWDITEEWQAHAEIENLARIFQESPHPLLRIASDGRVLLSNAASQPLLEAWGVGDSGRAPEELVSRFANVLAAGKVTPNEMEVDGRTVRLSLVPVPEQGYVNAYGEDVTAERRSAERLRQTQKMEAVGQLTGGIAHDFNNRLTVVLGNLELLEQRLANHAPTVDLVKRARRAAEGGANLTRQLLTFSRRQIEEPQCVDVNERIRGLDTMIGRTLGETIDVELNLSASTWPVLTDPGQLEDAVLNLCFNARDAMPEGGRLTIESDNVVLEPEDIRGRPYLVPGNYAMIAVTDTGCGIPHDILDRIFEPFFTTKATGKGTGLGLSMVYGFAKQSGGHVHVYSEVGRGTCFKIYLPCHERRAVVHPNDNDAPGAWMIGRILVVEDDEAVRRVATAVLTQIGHSVVAVENGPAAVEHLENHSDIDLLFTDVVMPGGMTGFELAEIVRERWPSIRLLFTSGYTDRGPFNSAEEQPEVAWVLKPYTRAKLASKVSEVLAAAPAGAGLDGAASG